MQIRLLNGLTLTYYDTKTVRSEERKDLIYSPFTLTLEEMNEKNQFLEELRAMEQQDKLKLLVQQGQ